MLEENLQNQSSVSTIGRNEPCPCGSGKKYKKCCLPREAPRVRSAPVAVQEPSEDHFVVELRPNLDKAADRLLERLESGEGKNLEAQFKALHQKAPGYYMTNYALGVYLAMVEKDPVGAIPFFEEAVRIFPPLAEAHLNLGASYIKAGRIAEATASLRKAVRYSDGEDGIDNLARGQLRQLDDIIRDSSPFLTVDEFIENQKLFDQAFECLRHKEYKKSAELFRRVLENHPGHVQSHGNLGLAEAALGHKAAALAHLDKALALDPSYGPALHNRRGIETMIEGRPHDIAMFAETEFYAEKREAEKRPKVGFWRKLNLLGRE